MFQSTKCMPQIPHTHRLLILFLKIKIQKMMGFMSKDLIYMYLYLVFLQILRCLFIGFKFMTSVNILVNILND